MSGCNGFVKRAALSMVCLLFSTVACFAISEDGKSEKGGAMPEVVVTGKKAEKAPYQRFPSTVNVISREEIASEKPTDVTDLLRRVPGVNYTDEDGRGFRPNLAMRGLDPTRSRNILLLADGFPVQPSTYGDPSAYYSVPVENVDQIEVIKGGAALLYGASSLGGAINYVTKRPPEKPLAATLKETVGDDSFFSSETELGGTSKPFSYRASYVRKQGEGFRESDGFSVHDASTYLGYQFSEDSELISRTNWYHEDSETPGGLTQAQYNANPLQSQYSDDNFEGRRFSTNLSLRHKLDERQRIEPYFNYTAFSRDWFIARATTTNQQFKRDFNVFGFGGKYHLDYDLLGMAGNTLTLGNEYYFDREDDAQENGTSRTATTGLKVTDNVLRTFAVAFYGVTDLHPTDRLTVSPIFRLDRVRSSLENRITGRDDAAMETAWLPGLGMDYLIGGATHLYGSVHRSFQPAEYKEAVDPTTGTSTNLDPQYGLHYEGGVKSDLTDWLNVDLAAFLFDFKNETITEGSARTNGQSTRHAGIEGSMSWDLFKTDGLGALSTTLGATLLDTEFRKGPNRNNELPYAPNWHLNGAVRYRHPKGFSANLNAEWVDEQFSSGNNSRQEAANGSTGIIPSYKVWNLNLGYDWNEHAGVFLAIKNLFNEKYFTRRDTFFTGIVPSPDRQIYGGVRVEF